MHEAKIIRDMPKALINWYRFEPGGETLFVSGGDEACEVFYEALQEQGLKAARVTADGLAGLGAKFDYIIAAGILERSGQPIELLSRLRVLLKPSGRMFVGAENRLALRYFCGDKDGFSGHVLDSIDGYVNVVGKGRENLR